MKKKISFLGLMLLLLWTAGCGRSEECRHYELVGGNPEIDYIDFLNDTLCRFVAPGPLPMTCRYTKQDQMYLIQINDLVTARLYSLSDDKLQGEVPFFDGIWVRKKK